MMAMIDDFQACMIKVGCGIGGWDMLTWTSFPNSTKMNSLEAFPKLIFKKTKFVKLVKWESKSKTPSKTKFHFNI